MVTASLTVTMHVPTNPARPNLAVARIVITMVLPTATMHVLMNPAHLNSTAAQTVMAIPFPTTRTLVPTNPVYRKMEDAQITVGVVEMGGMEVTGETEK